MARTCVIQCNLKNFPFGADSLPAEACRLFRSSGIRNLRVKQKELSLEMLRALQENKLALYEAEVGTGKTHAYILALTVHSLYSQKKKPVLISTSTIALQKALSEEYIPQISRILLEHHVIEKPLKQIYGIATRYIP